MIVTRNVAMNLSLTFVQREINGQIYNITGSISLKKVERRVRVRKEKVYIYVRNRQASYNFMKEYEGVQW